MLVILFIPLAILIILFYYLSSGRNGNQTPGPKGKILIGVISEVKLETLHHKLYEWSLKYGDIFQFSLMGKTFVSLNSSDALREAFLKEPNATITAARPATFSGKYVLDNYSDLSFASISEKWIKLRKFHHELVHAYGEGLEYIEKQIKYSLGHFKKEVSAFKEKDQNPADCIEEFIFETIEIMLIGRGVGKEGEIRKCMRKFQDLGNKIANPGIDFLYKTFPFLLRLPLPMSGIINEVIHTKQQLMDLLISYTENGEHEKRGILFRMKEAVSDNKMLDDPWFTQTNMAASTANLIGAAFLTTRGALTSVVQLLTKRPTLQQKLQQEIDKVIGLDRDPKLSDREKCPLTEAVILETLRYISHIPVALLHETTKSCTIKGYHIGKGVTIIPNLWTIHHSEKVWGDPFNFRPERFLDDNEHLLPITAPERRGLHVFGLGKRSCVGEVFAKSRMFLFLATLMQTFTILEPESESLPDLLPNDMIAGITLQPRPYKVKFVFRANVS